MPQPVFPTTSTSSEKVPVADSAANALSRDVLGNKADAAVQAVAANKSAIAYLKGALDMLAGTAGVAAFPNAAAPANGVSLAEVLRSLHASLQGTAAGENGISTWPTAAAYGNNVSIAEVLAYVQDLLTGSAGVPTYPAAAPAANGVSLAEVLRHVQDSVNTTATNRNATNYFALDVDFTNATWNTVASHEILTVTGTVRIVLLPEVTATLTSGGVPGLVLSDESLSASLIATTVSTSLGTGEWWVDDVETRTVARSSLFLDFVVAGKDIGYEISGSAMTGGSIRFHCWWTPISSDGAVVAGSGGTL